jgi:predicted porin
MKKSLLAFAVLGAASGFAFAASNVTLYGLIETGVSVSKAKHNDAVVEMTSGFDSGSRWGIKGTEDLGNGYNVGFLLEQGFSSDTGAAASSIQAFSREAILSLNGGFGSAAIGRTGALAFAQSRAILTGWVFGTGYSKSAWNSIDWVAKRMNNVVSYATPSFGGVTFHAMYSNSGAGDTKKNSEGQTVIVDDANKWSKNGHYYGIGAKLARGPLTSSLIFEAAQNKDLAATANRNAKYGINFGASYNFGVITPMFAYQYIWQSEGNKDHQFGLSASAPVASGTVKIGAKYLFGKNYAGETSKKQNMWLVGAAYEYPFSKRTKLKTYAGYADAGKAWKDKEDVAYNGYQVFAGIQHNF